MLRSDLLVPVAQCGQKHEIKPVDNNRLQAGPNLLNVADLLLSQTDAVAIATNDRAHLVST